MSITLTVEPVISFVDTPMEDDARASATDDEAWLAVEDPVVPVVAEVSDNTENDDVGESRPGGPAAPCVTDDRDSVDPVLCIVSDTVEEISDDPVKGCSDDAFDELVSVKPLNICPDSAANGLV